MTSTCYRGVIVDQYSTCKLHVNYVLKRIRHKLYALNHMKSLPDYILSQLHACLAHFQLL